MERHRGLMTFAQAQIDHLDEHGEPHREVDIALRHFNVESLGDEHHADHQEKRERQHFDGRMPRDEMMDPARHRHHEDHGQHDRHRHDADVLYHADGGDDRVEREHDVDDDDLHQDRAKARLDGSALGVRVGFELLVKFADGLVDQEEAAG